MNVSTLIFLGLAVVWAIVLLPEVLRKLSVGRRSDSIRSFNHQLSVLHRSGNRRGADLPGMPRPVSLNSSSARTSSNARNSSSNVIDLRYLLTVPIYLISLIGFNPMLIIKFFQLIALLHIYKLTRQFIAAQLICIRFWHLPLIAGPILVFMSLLSLRDVLLAYFALVFVASNSYKYKILGLSCVFLLRPHLAVALVFAFGLTHIYIFWKPKYQLIAISTFTLVSYVAGTITYWI